MTITTRTPHSEPQRGDVAHDELVLHEVHVLLEDPLEEVLRVLADRHDRDGGLGAALGERLCLVELDRSNCLTLGKL